MKMVSRHCLVLLFCCYNTVTAFQIVSTRSTITTAATVSISRTNQYTSITTTTTTSATATTATTSVAKNSFTPNNTHSSYGRLNLYIERDADYGEILAGGQRYAMVELPDSMVDTTLFVGNLCEFVTDDMLSSLFQQVSTLNYLPACVVRKPNMTSRKYGFVTFPSVSEKEDAIIKFKGYELNNKALKVECIQDDKSNNLRVRVPEKFVVYAVGEVKRISKKKNALGKNTMRRVTNSRESLFRDDYDDDNTNDYYGGDGTGNSNGNSNGNMSSSLSSFDRSSTSWTSASSPSTTKASKDRKKRKNRKRVQSFSSSSSSSSSPFVFDERGDYKNKKPKEKRKEKRRNRRKMNNNLNDFI